MKKILIVEDEAAYLKLLSSQLIEQGYQVIQAIDGKEGLQKAKTENPDLILLDIRMQKMNGLKMLSLLRKEKQGSQTKVIILTNLEPSDKIIGEVISNQPSFYFVKSDIKFKELLLKIKELMVD